MNQAERDELLIRLDERTGHIHKTSQVVYNEIYGTSGSAGLKSRVCSMEEGVQTRRRAVLFAFGLIATLGVLTTILFTLLQWGK
jgi:hypothetical protein